MKRRKLISVLLAATMMAAMFAGCGSDAASTDAKENADGADSTEAGGVKEFTAFFAVPGSEINDDNEIQQIIADKTGVKVKETSPSPAIGGGDVYPNPYLPSLSSWQLLSALSAANLPSVASPQVIFPRRNAISFSV